MCFTSDVECLIHKEGVVEIFVSSLKGITIQITVDSAPSQDFQAIETAFASVLSSVSLEEFAIRRLVKTYDRRSNTFNLALYCTLLVQTRLFSTYLHITRSKIIERMTFAGETLPEIATLEDPANFRGGAWWMGIQRSPDKKMSTDNVNIVLEYRINVSYDGNLKMVYTIKIRISIPREKLRAVKKIDLRLTFTPNKKFWESMLNKKMKKKKKIQETKKSRNV
ncbi:hypothetical protein HZH68_016219 [Vespula germanica]|uniref:Uncharacterized protein n=1 Tax=Vespula germanica TaxID=30212 RepID=A0A834J4L6_VESGE|nr:hypothetical protein HZH68_016219 [Vespula germanica]